MYSQKTREKILKMAAALGVNQFELIDAVFGIVDIETQGLIDKVREVKVLNQKEKDKKRRALAKVKSLSETELNRLLEKL